MRESAVVSNDARRRDVGDGERAGQELTRRNFLKAGGGVLAGVYALQLAGCGQRGVPRQPDRPNILFLMADQYRWDALGSVDSLVRRRTWTLWSPAVSASVEPQSTRPCVCQAVTR